MTEPATDGTDQSDTVVACPECDRASVQHASKTIYQCQVCKATFPTGDVVERKRRGPNGIRGDSLAAQLDAADPDGLMTDGGTDQSTGGTERVNRDELMECPRCGSHAALQYAMESCPECGSSCRRSTGGR